MGRTPLGQLVLKEKPKWEHSSYYTHCHAAIKAGFRPSEFGLCTPGQDLAIMLAVDEVEAKMQNYENELEAERVRKEQMKADAASGRR